jgi:signal transduction histidine kinase/Tfp pilus assembly protein PilF
MVFSLSTLRFYTSLFFLAGWYCTNAQEQRTVSAIADTATINRLQRQAYLSNNVDTAIVWFDSALKASLASGYQVGVARAYMGAGLRFLEQGNYTRGLANFNEALPYSFRSHDTETIASNYINKGLALFYLGDYTQSAESYHLAEIMASRIRPPLARMHIKIYTNLGITCFRMGQLQWSSHYMQQAVQLARALNNPSLLAKSLLNLGSVYDSINTDSAIALYTEALIISRTNFLPETEAYACENIGSAYLLRGDYRNAVFWLQKAIETAKDKYPYVFIEASYDFGKALILQGRFREAEKILLNALALVHSFGLRDDMERPYQLLANIYRNTGRYKMAMAFQDTFYQIQDSLASIQKSINFSRLELQYKTAEKDQLLAKNQLIIAQQNARMASKNTTIVLVIGLAVALLLLAIIWWIRHRNWLQSLEQANKIEVLRAAVQGADRERSRIAADLHDGIGGMLSAAMMRFMAIHHEKKDITNVAAYNEAMNLLDEMGDEIRKTAHNLMPEALLKQSLPEAVQSFCTYMQGTALLRIEFQHFGDFPILSQEVKLSAYRIIQELLRNACQHSKASQVLVQLIMQQQLLIITVEDNGSGFDTTKQYTGMGLHNLQTRINSLDGHCTIESQPGRGTSVNIEFDIHKLTNT